MTLITDDQFDAIKVNYANKVYRMVETQEYAATTSLVDNFDEQAILEELLDDVKPGYFPGTEEKHYLIKTPFRYPPLKHGSRFGSRLEPSYFYASESIDTVLGEVAYYRFLFFSHMDSTYTKHVNSEHAVFYVLVKTPNAADLSCIESSDVLAELSHPSRYSRCQQTGNWLRKKGIELIRYFSARHKGGINVAVSTVECIKSATPQDMSNWLCQSSMSTVSFTGPGQPVYHFDISDYLIDGNLPDPAN